MSSFTGHARLGCDLDTCQLDSRCKMRKLVWLDPNEPIEPLDWPSVAVEGFLLFLGSAALVIGFSLLVAP